MPDEDNSSVYVRCIRRNGRRRSRRISRFRFGPGIHGLLAALVLCVMQGASTGHGKSTVSVATWNDIVRPAGLSAEEKAGMDFLAQSLDPSDYLALDPETRRLLIRYAADYRDGEPTLVLCWELHTDPTIVRAFHELEEASERVRRERKRNVPIGTAYQADPSDHWGTTATNGGSQGIQGLPVTLTWSIVPDGTIIPGGEIGGEPTNDPSNLRTWLQSLYGGSATAPAADQPWFPLFQSVFDEISAKTGVRYVYEPNDDGATLSSLPGGAGALGVRGDVRISGHALDGNSNVLAYNYFPDYADMVIDTSDNFFDNTSNDSLRLYNVIAHEHGHGLGLSHVCPVDNTKLMEPYINLGFRGYQFDDVYTAQRLYGDFLEVHDFERDNDTATSATPVSTPTNVPFIAEWVGIDDDSDSDFYRFEVPAGTQLTVHVVPSSQSYLEGSQNPITGSCSSGANFNSGTIHDLAFEILDTDQSTILASGASQPAGVAESVADLAITTAGTYYVHVVGGAADSNQLYRLEIEVNAPSVALQLVSSTIASELFQVSNGAPDPNETVALEIELRNVGLLDGTGIQATLTGPPGVQVFQATYDYGDLSSGSSSTGTFVLAADGTCGDTVALQLHLTGSGGYVATIPVSLVLGVEETHFEEHFDGSASLPAGWQTAETGKGSDWSVVNSAANSPPNSVFAANPQQAGQSILTSPSIAMGDSGGTLIFSHWFDTETNWDGGVLEIKIGAGAWQDILDAGGTFESGGYNLAVAGINNPLAGRSAWSGDSGGFITTTVVLPDSVANQSIQFRWIIGHDNRVSANGWFIDDVILRNFACDASGAALTLSCSDDSTSEFHSATDSAEITVSAGLPVPFDIPVALTPSGSADPLLDVSGFADLTIAAGNASASETITAVSDGLVEGNETLQISSPDATGNVSITIEDTPYGQWASSTMGTTGLVNPDDDFDLDGSPNVEELIYGTDAGSGSSWPENQLMPNGTNLELAVPLGSLPEGVTVDALTSTDLILWTSDGVTVLPDGFRIPIDGDKRFLKLIYGVVETAN